MSENKEQGRGEDAVILGFSVVIFLRITGEAFPPGPSPWLTPWELRATAGSGGAGRYGH